MGQTRQEIIADINSKIKTNGQGGISGAILQGVLDNMVDNLATTEESPFESGTGTNSAVQKGGSNIASGDYSYAEGSHTTASGENGCSHAEGYNTEASGDCSHAEGSTTHATEVQAHAEGYLTTASGSRAHAEGEGTTASGSDSHAEGKNTTAKASKSHAEGEGSYANGSISHAEGWGTKTNNKAEHAEGSYNSSINGGTAAQITRHSVGIGTSDNDRKNAFEIMQNGDTYIKGVGTYNGTNPTSGTNDVATVINLLTPMIVDGDTIFYEDAGESYFEPKSGQPSYEEALAAYQSGRTVICKCKNGFDNITEYANIVGYTGALKFGVAITGNNGTVSEWTIYVP